MFLKQLLPWKTDRLTLDIAHLYMAEQQYLDALENVLRTYNDQIPAVHLCDGTKQEDGLPFGHGDIDITAVGQLLADTDFDGIVTLEMMPQHQEAAYDRFTAMLDDR